MRHSVAACKALRFALPRIEFVATRPTRFALPARLHEPVADEIGLRRYTPFHTANIPETYFSPNPPIRSLPPRNGGLPITTSPSGQSGSLPSGASTESSTANRTSSGLSVRAGRGACPSYLLPPKAAERSWRSRPPPIPSCPGPKNTPVTTPKSSPDARSSAGLSGSANP